MMTERTLSVKRVLITGKNSYIGTSLEKWLLREPEKYFVHTIDVRGEEWKEHDFSHYDVVFHVAGIAHVKESKVSTEQYYRVNRDLAFCIASFAKKCGVKHFIFMSSMSVYGIDCGAIDLTTIANPKSAYGKSKLEAEFVIQLLQDRKFGISVLRPPMVYGKNCSGNYMRLSKLVKFTKVFPKVENKRSMIFIDNLTEFIKQVIDKSLCGLLFPQNSEFVCSSEMVKLIAEAQGKRMIFSKFFNPLLLNLNIKVVQKIFGDLTYVSDISNYDFTYRVCSFTDSIVKSETEIV